MKPTQSTRKTIAVIACLFIAPSFFAQKTEIQVLSAVVKDAVIPGAQVIFQKNGEASVSATTDSNGKISIASPFGGVDDASVTMIIKKEGYSTLVTKGPCNKLVYAISPTMQTLDGLRVVLSWNNEPLDLDSHLSFPGNHIYFEKKAGTKANLDVDDTDGFGPETITVEKKEAGKKYIYAVHDYTDMKSINNTNLSEMSGAKVYVYIGNTLIKTYQVPSGGKKGNLWTVFMIDENGNFVDINTFNNSSSSLNTGLQLEAYLESNEMFAQTTASMVNIQESINVNSQGEEAYHNGDLESSVTFYQRAIELDPNNDQAYSNLGLSFQKLNREAEAIWANRKAIALAHGADEKVVKASSHYNIAKIYEKKGQWQDALNHFTLAKSFNANTAYDNGIKRMKEKLGRN
ncbi:MAG TPA: tetratricopeptide repeat protein [Fluviicola sp.]|nr:tetratricopeptide repeat protein [Fluviicola sp.]